MSELAEIYRIYFDDVYRYLLALSHDAQLAEELTSETFCPASAPSLEEQLTDRDDAARIRAALHSAPEPYKEVFLWRALGGLSFRTIGQLFGKSENWACVTYHRAKTIIRKNMEGST